MTLVTSLVTSLVTTLVTLVTSLVTSLVTLVTLVTSLVTSLVTLVTLVTSLVTSLQRTGVLIPLRHSATLKFFQSKFRLKIFSLLFDSKRSSLKMRTLLCCAAYARRCIYIHTWKRNTHVTYCDLQNNWNISIFNGMQRLLVPVYY